MIRLKKQIAYLIGTRDTYEYRKNLEYIYENRYRTIDKVPIRMLFIGILSTIADATIQLIKEVIIEALEQSGIETTLSDQDWVNLAYLEEPNNYHSKYLNKKLNTRKVMMYEFFE